MPFVARNKTQPAALPVTCSVIGGNTLLNLDIFFFSLIFFILQSQPRHNIRSLKFLEVHASSCWPQARFQSVSTDRVECSYKCRAVV